MLVRQSNSINDGMKRHINELAKKWRPRDKKELDLTRNTINTMKVVTRDEDDEKHNGKHLGY